VGALSEVEAEGLGVLVRLLLRGVGRGILDTACLARARTRDLVVGVDEQAGGGDGQDVATRGINMFVLVMGLKNKWT